MEKKKIVVMLFDSNFLVHKIEFTTVLKSKSKGMNRRVKLFIESASLFRLKNKELLLEDSQYFPFFQFPVNIARYLLIV